MTRSNLLDKNLIKIGIEANDQNEALDVLSNTLYEHGYVKDTYIDAIKVREENFATGLPSEGIGVAIPHASIEHVVKPSIAIGTLQKPVTFRMMGDHDEIVEVGIMIMLALKEHHAQLEMLQSLMGVIQDADILDKIINSKDSDEVLKILSSELS